MDHKMINDGFFGILLSCDFERNFFACFSSADPRHIACVRAISMHTHQPLVASYHVFIALIFCDPVANIIIPSEKVPLASNSENVSGYGKPSFGFIFMAAKNTFK
jgi:hypothetical protein